MIGPGRMLRHARSGNHRGPKRLRKLSAELAIAIDWLRRESYERAIETLTLVMVDLQRMELRAPFTAGRGRQRDHAPGRHSTDDRVRAAASPSSAGVLGPSRSAQPAPPHGASGDTLPDDVGCLSLCFRRLE